MANVLSNHFYANFHHQGGGGDPKVIDTNESGSLRCFIWHLGKSNQIYDYGVINR